MLLKQAVGTGRAASLGGQVLITYDPGKQTYHVC